MAKSIMAKYRLLASPANPLLKDVRRAISRGSLTSDGLLTAETFHLVEEALRSKLEVPMVIAAEGARSEVERLLDARRGIRLLVVSDSLFQTLGGTESVQGVLALVRPPQWKLEDLFTGVPLVVVLDGLQDPGNAGAIVRAAEAFSSTGIVFLKGSVSPFNTKTIRASAGSLFRLPFAAGLDAELVTDFFRRRRLKVYATSPRGELPLPDADLRTPLALIIGSEARGVSAAFAQGASVLRIPTSGVESLNAALAAAVVLYEASRQRQQGRTQ